MKIGALTAILFSMAIAVYGQSNARIQTENAVKALKLNLDSSKVLFEKAYSIAESDTTRAGITYRYVTQAVDFGDFNYLTHRAVIIRDSKTFNDLPGKYKSQIYNAFFDIHYWITSNYDSCLYYTTKWIETPTDTLWLAYGYLERGAAWNEAGNNVKALEDYNSCLSLVPSLPYDRDLASSLYNNFGMLYSDEHEYEKATEYFEKSLEYGKNTKVPAGTLPMINNLGVLYMWMGEYEKSKKYLDQAATMLATYDQPWSVANNIQNMGNVLTLMGKPKEGVEKYKQAIVMFEKLKEEHKMASLHRLMAEAHRLLGDYKQAEQEALLCLTWDRQKGSGELVKESYQELYKIYSATHQYEKAFDYQNRYLSIVDSLNSAERKTKFGLLEKNYELAQQEKVREELEDQNALHKANAKADRVTLISLIVGSIVLAFAAVAAVMAYRRSRFKSEKIEAQAEQLREAAKTKARFFANVSHELRTPITLLNGMLELMKDSVHNGQAEKMEIALGNSRKLQSMLNDVLDLSRVEEGKWELQLKHKEVLPLLNRIVMSFESLLVKKNIELRYNGNSLEGLSADIDEDKFEKIINNLIYNAVKFNRPGGWIGVSAQRTESTIVIQVSDSGIGISEKEQASIFDRHYQSAATETLQSQGIGIGLALVREFTLLHGGDVSVTSQLNEGSCFTITLPIKAKQKVIQTEVSEPLQEVLDVSFDNFAHKPVVLVVEDNDEMRFYLKEVLGGHVITVEAPNGKRALEWLSAHKPDLIISDVMMPEMDGYEFLSHIKSSNELRGIPVVMLTARATEEDMLQGLSLGVDDYIIKPFSAKELKIRIHNLLINQEIRREWSVRPIEAEEPHETSTPSENELFIEKVRTFVEENASNASLGIGDLGEYLAMSERQVYRKAATLTGMTPAQLMKEIRLRIAYRLLLERKVTKVSDLAQRVGFENSSYFSKQFFDRYGKRPTEFLD